MLPQTDEEPVTNEPRPVHLARKGRTHEFGSSLPLMAGFTQKTRGWSLFKALRRAVEPPSVTPRRGEGWIL